MNARLLVVLFSVFFAFVLNSIAERPIMVLQASHMDHTEPVVIWSTLPGLQYELQATHNLSDHESWMPVLGFPREANSLAQQFSFPQTNNAGHLFWRVIQLDDHPPRIHSRIPHEHAFGVGRFAPISFSLEDVTGIDLDSIIISVGGHGTFTLADSELTHSDGVITFGLGPDTPLGDFGATVAVTLVAADLLGNVAEKTLDLELEVEPLVSGELFVFGSNDSRSRGQRLHGAAVDLADRLSDPVGIPYSNLHWSIEYVLDDRILLTYGDGASMISATDRASSYSQWISGSNHGDGFEPWVLSADEYSGHWAQADGWGMWSHQGGNIAEARRSFLQPLDVGQVFSLTFRNGWVWEEGGSVGVAFHNDQGDSVWSLEFIGGEIFYVTSDGETTIPWTDRGLHISFMIVDSETYFVDIWPGAGSRQQFSGTFTGDISEFRVWSSNNGVELMNERRDFFVDNLAITSRIRTGGQAAPDFSTAEYLANLAPANVFEMFYRRLERIDDFPNAGRLVLHTTDTDLPEVAADMSFGISRDRFVYLNFDRHGTLLRSLDFDGLLPVPVFEADLSGIGLNSPGQMTLVLDEGLLRYAPMIQASVDAQNGRIERLALKADGDLGISCMPHISVLSADASIPCTAIWSSNVWIWGSAGVLPVGIEMGATIHAQADAAFDWALDSTVLLQAGFLHQGSLNLVARYNRDVLPEMSWESLFRAGHFHADSVITQGEGSGFVRVTLIPEIDITIHGAAQLQFHFDPRLKATGRNEITEGTTNHAQWNLGAYADLYATARLIDRHEEQLPHLPRYRLFSRQWGYNDPSGVSSGIQITQQPVSQWARQGDTVVYSVTALGNAELSYQWYHDNQLLPGQIRRELVLNNVSGEYQGNYHARISARNDVVYSSTASLQITAEGVTGPLRPDMVLIPDGTNNGTDPDFGAYSLTVDEFHMDPYPVTKAFWSEVYSWAILNGYSFDNAGSGKAANHPVHTVNWYDVVKWCNARSEMEGRPPVYSVNGEVYRTGQHDNVMQSSAGGYRLPTAVEWEYAARGGLQSQRFPWGNEIQHARANYSSSSSDSYDTSPTRGYHPAYNDGNMPYTSPVGSFAANGYGMYDMAGNVWEWVFDGDASWGGSFRMLRGGGWSAFGASGCRVGFQYGLGAGSAGIQFGFRSVLPTAEIRALRLVGNLHFGDVVLGTAIERYFSIANIGNTPVTVSNISHPPGFAIDWPAGTIDVGSTQAVTMTFSPTDEMVYAGQISIVSDALNSSDTITVSGRGVDLPSVPADMVLIPAGTNSGTNLLGVLREEVESHSDSYPATYDLTVDSFYMDQYPVTKALWDQVYAWATHPARGDNVYSFDNAGSGKGSNHPVQTINWYDAVKWCNARSEMEGRPPVYTVNGAVYRIGRADNVVYSSAAGYRLPTEVEWEYAARGGLQSQRFPWGNEIQHAMANYWSSISISYDTSPTRENHPTYDDGNEPYTAPVGSFAANEYGLFGMAGNVWEWVFEWHPSSVGSHRVHRGGSWHNWADLCRVGYRYRRVPTHAQNYIGFRVVLPL